MAIASRARRGATTALGLLALLFGLGLGLHTFVANFVRTKTEVRGIRTKVHTGLDDMHVGIELAPDGHDLALERRRKRPQAPEVHDVAVGYDFACHICGEVQDALHFHVIEGRVFGHQLAEALEAHTMTARRRGLNHHFAFVRPDAYLALAEGVTNGFVFLTHNYLRCLHYLRCLQLVVLAPVGDVIQEKGKVCFSSSESLSA